ncbi:hypothetical protein SAMN04488020_1104 [Palleronia marisminoris]|uniref:Lipoprotein n=1 Tax=Palleronia marisminoris TaxID=315423 RepID=A0A1Y5TDF6_9RHOB|nr:hypothetical protein [Palleronia marisminoris]SFH31754.1 hypothetical protein SAMN04488020_1104 [Palleronia marisminoris]SLN61498.1 hypothetical protein PAM7066_03074 [Palleronia marisminoris]
MEVSDAAFQSFLPVVVVAAAASAAAAQDTSPTLSVEESADFDQYIVGPDGEPVYMFTTDIQGDGGEPAISCTSVDCLNAWPLVTADGELTARPELEESLAGTFSYKDQTVVTYNGWIISARTAVTFTRRIG